MEKTKTIVIFGISSFVGSNLADFLKKKYRVIGTYYETPVKIPGILTLPCDVLKKEEVMMVMYAAKPDMAIYTVGLSSVSDCAKADTMADALNTMGMFNVSDACQRYKAQLCYISSAYVFGGENRNYKEMDIPDANTILGKTKASAEFYIQKTSLNYIIFRCCNLYGRSICDTQSTWFEKLQNKMSTNEAVSLDNKVHLGFLDVNYLGMIIQICLQKGVANRLIQISSTDFLTHYEFGKLYADIFKESASLLSKGQWPFQYIMSATSNYAGGDLYYQLDIANVEGYLNLKMPSVEESLRFTFKRFNGVEKGSRSKKTGDELTFI